MSESDSDSSSDASLPPLPFNIATHHLPAGMPFNNFFRILGPMMGVGAAMAGAPFLGHDPHPTPEKESIRSLRSQHRHTDDYARMTQKFLEGSLEAMDRLNESSRSGEVDIGEEGNETLSQLNTVQEKVNKTLHEFYFQLLEEAELIKKLIDYVQPPTLPLFMKKWQPALDASSAVEVHPSNAMNCIVCSDNAANTIIKRACAKSNIKGSACEDKECQCGAICCRECMVHHFWSASDNGKKTYARCPHCRAEFCMIDLHNVKYTESAARRKELGPPTPLASSAGAPAPAQPSAAQRTSRRHSVVAPSSASSSSPPSRSSGRANRREAPEPEDPTPDADPSPSRPNSARRNSGGPPPFKLRKR